MKHRVGNQGEEQLPDSNLCHMRAEREWPVVKNPCAAIWQRNVARGLEKVHEEARAAVVCSMSRVSALVVRRISDIMERVFDGLVHFFLGYFRDSVVNCKAEREDLFASLS